MIEPCLDCSNKEMIGWSVEFCELPKGHKGVHRGMGAMWG